MNGTATIVAVITVLAALVLALRGIRSYRLPLERRAWMAVSWVVIILVLGFAMSRFYG